MKIVRLLTLLSVVITAHQTSAAPARSNDHDEVVRDVMERAGIPGLQSVVVKDGKVLQARSYGYAVLDEPGPRRAMTNDAVLFSASVGKLLVSIAVMQQVEVGKLGLDDDINDSLPFLVRNPYWPQVAITWRMLLSHSSSMDLEPDEQVNRTAVYGSDPSSNLNDYIESVFQPASAKFWKERYRSGKPGSERIYSNDAFDLMAYALQRLLKEPFDEYAARRILRPLHMDASSYWLKGHGSTPYAVGYTSEHRGKGFKYTPIKTYWEHLPATGRAIDHQMTCPNYASGCLHTTALDLSRLMLMLMHGGALEGQRLLSPSSIDVMASPTGLRNLDGWRQGVGMYGPEDFRGRQVWGHDGEERGSADAFFFNRKSGMGAILLSNAMDPEFTLTYVVENLDLELMLLFE